METRVLVNAGIAFETRFVPSPFHVDRGNLAPMVVMGGTWQKRHYNELPVNIIKILISN